MGWVLAPASARELRSDLGLGWEVYDEYLLAKR
jgi:hypothetical protein